MVEGTMIRRTRVDIDLQAIVGNAAAVRDVTGTISNLPLVRGSSRIASPMWDRM